MPTMAGLTRSPMSQRGIFSGVALDPGDTRNGRGIAVPSDAGDL